MAFLDMFSRVVEGIGAAAIVLRGQDGRKVTQAFGANPAIPAAKAQGSIPTLKMPTARGWPQGKTPNRRSRAQGQRVRDRSQASPMDLRAAERRCARSRGAFDAGTCKLPFRLRHDQHAETGGGHGREPEPHHAVARCRRDGVAEIKNTFLERQNQPFGMALVGDTFYVGNTDGVVAFPYTAGANSITGQGRKLTTHNGGGHWTRSLLLSPDKTKLFIGVGSLTNIADKGMGVEQGRAAIHELDLASGKSRIFASGLRNPVGLAWEPQTGALWTVVNERDGLGDETPPDYLTSVRDGGFYGWPYCYWGKTVDDRVPQDAALVASAIQPDYALGGHTASLGLCWLPAGVLPGFAEGMVIGQHGSWNRSTLSGYKVIFVPFANGRPVGPSRDILSGFLAPDERSSFGRPVGVALGPDGSLLVADDVGNVIWRVTGA